MSADASRATVGAVDDPAASGGRLDAFGVRYAGIGDEAAVPLDDQLRAIGRLGWDAVELRNVDGVPLAALDDHTTGRLAEQLAGARLDVVCLDSRIANWGRPITHDLADDLNELQALARLSARLGTRWVRVMSYPNDDLDPETWRRRVLRRMATLTRVAEDHGLVLLHENCSGWAGTRADRMLELLSHVDSPALRLLFDTGNGVPHGYPAGALLREVVEHVAHVHVKDAATGPDGQVGYTLPGHGTAGVADCLTTLLEHGYTGVWSIEPHTHLRPHQGRELTDGGGVEAFVRYGRELERLVRETVLPRVAAAGGGSRNG